ncbi:hypothetical protein A3838_23345 [Streptomyces badius]|nr:hypothetical protein A3838_23345 [Streptomyces badius]
MQEERTQPVGGLLDLGYDGGAVGEAVLDGRVQLGAEQGSVGGIGLDAYEFGEGVRMWIHRTSPGCGR